MKRFWYSYFLVFFSFSLITVPSTASAQSLNRGIEISQKNGRTLYLYSDYYALVVGISDYDTWPDLPNAVADASEVAVLFERLGANVHLLTNPTSGELEAALNDLTYYYGQEPNRALILYYAGHGETEALADGTKLGYIIPCDCPPMRKDPRGFVMKAISMKDIEAYSLRIRSKHVLMLFDSCFSGSIFSLVRAMPDDIREKTALPVRQYITAGTENERVPDRSMFKRCLLLGLKGDADLIPDGYITGSELGLYLSEKVVKYTKGRQHPQYGKINNPGLDLGDFVFVGQRASAPKAVASDEGDERRALSQELEKLKAEVERLSRLSAGQQNQATGENPLVYAPKQKRLGTVPRVKLRDTPKDVWPSDVRKMIAQYNFYIKSENEHGDFSNDLVDNGDGTITDFATGLMWQKGGSSPLRTLLQAEKYLSGLNKNKFARYNDWRIPTIEELCSLADNRPNRAGWYCKALFNGERAVCLSSDQCFNISSSASMMPEACCTHCVLDFSSGAVEETATQNIGFVNWCYSTSFILKAVRTIGSSK